MHGRRPPCRLGWKVQIGVGYMLCGLFVRSVELCFWTRVGVGGLQRRGLGCVHSVFGVLRVLPMLWHCLLAGAGPLVQVNVKLAGMPGWRLRHQGACKRKVSAERPEGPGAAPFRVRRRALMIKASGSWRGSAGTNCMI